MTALISQVIAWAMHLPILQKHRSNVDTDSDNTVPAQESNLRLFVPIAMLIPLCRSNVKNIVELETSMRFHFITPLEV